MGFRKDFVWGAATSAYQIEGAAREGGKGLHVWDAFCAVPGNIYENQTGLVACDHYHRYRQDVQLMKELGIKGYRFSIDWSRVLPEGTGPVNEEGIAFYNRLIDSLLEAGIEPYITLFHWELPLALYRKGGWMNPQIVEWFGDYTALIARRFSDRVRYFFTMNEPQCFVGLAYVQGTHAPGLRLPAADTLLMAHHVLMAHGRAVQQLRAHARQPLQIGYAPTGSMSYPATDSPEDIEAARTDLFSMPAVENWAWNVAWWSDPVMLGRYPEEGLKKYEACLPHITDEDMKLICQPLDFYGQNIYNGKCIRMGRDGKPEEVPRYAGFPTTANGWPVTPECLYWGPKFLYERYQKPVYITENGLASQDVVSVDGMVHDTARVDFLDRYLANLRRAAEDGVDIRGYFHWSLLDNFEWCRGYLDRFGMIYVDYPTQKRIWKDSAYWYQKVIRENGASLGSRNL